MTIQEVIDEVKATRSPTADPQRLLKWIYLAEAEAAEDGDPPEVYGMEDLDRTLLIEPPYDELYVRYCVYRMDLLENQIDNANNALAQYETLLDRYKKWRIRTYMPQAGPRIRLEGYNV